MMRWIDQFRKASSQTKWFILNWFIWGLVLAITTVYAYGRLDFVRSYPTSLNTQPSKERPKL